MSWVLRFTTQLHSIPRINFSPKHSTGSGAHAEFYSVSNGYHTLRRPAGLEAPTITFKPLWRGACLSISKYFHLFPGAHSEYLICWGWGLNFKAVL